MDSPRQQCWQSSRGGYSLEYLLSAILQRLLGSSDDKEKEKIGIARPLCGSQGSALKTLRSVAPEEPTHEAPVHPMVVGRTDAMVFWCRSGSKPSQLIGTG